MQYMNEGKPEGHPSAEEHHEGRIEDPLLAHELALSTKTLHDAAAELRRKARTGISRVEEKLEVRLSSDRIKGALREKAKRIDEVAEALEKDAVSTVELVKGEPNEKKRRLMLMYELVKARTLAGFYTFFNRVDDLSAEDVWTEDDERALRDYYQRMDEKERKRKESFIPPSPAVPTFILKMSGLSDEEIEHYKNFHLPRNK